jgi:two-component system, NtrC family, nitrogen regulation sensor histidine kinase NtrY
LVQVTKLLNPAKAFGGPVESRRLLALPGVLIVVSSLLIAAVSFTILMGITPITPTNSITQALSFLNAAMILMLIMLIAREIDRILRARHHGRAAARLHVRIVALFSLVAAVPAVVVAIVAATTLNIGLDRWFAIRTKDIVNSSISIARSYVEENARNLQGTTLSMAVDLDASRTLYSLDRSGFEQLLNRQAAGRGLLQASLVRLDGSVIVSSAKTEGAGDLPPVPTGVLETAADGQPVLIPPRDRNLVGAVFKMREIENAFLYTIRAVDKQLIDAVKIVNTNAAEYQGLEENRTTTQIAFALLYLGLTLVVLLSAIWTGIAVADRLVRPIRMLIGASDAVASGDLDVVVPVSKSDGDVGFLSDTFNKMIQQLKTQRNEILSAKDQIDERRRFSEAVLSGVTAAVIGVDPDGVISIANKSADVILGIDADKATGQMLSAVLPELGTIFELAKSTDRAVYKEQATFIRKGSERTYNVQITSEESQDAEHSFVVTVDDITELVTAQRSSAWSDIARRIAHEIKNPLTPIQLSAERIKRRFGKVIVDDREIFDQCTDTIIRQVGDIGRMVDEFSAFARMPKPTMSALDIRQALKESAFLIEVSRPDVLVEKVLPQETLLGMFDSRMIGQALGNLIKNATEAIDARPEERAGQKGHVKVKVSQQSGSIVVDIMDNGKGLPRENRQRLLEPYMTTREKGTGLGLAIVRKIVEEHNGVLSLHDAPADFHGGVGANIRLEFPLLQTSLNEMQTTLETNNEMKQVAENGI